MSDEQERPVEQLKSVRLMLQYDIHGKFAVDADGHISEAHVRQLCKAIVDRGLPATRGYTVKLTTCKANTTRDIDVKLEVTDGG